MTDELCPICHSNIDPLNPDWTKDPVLTIRGLAGDKYKGVIKLDIKYIKEIQDKRKQQEIDVGIPEEERTQFTEITPGKTFFSKKLINELRESTEKILTNGEEVSEEKRRELLNEYFNYNEDGEYVGTYKYGQKVDDKEEWTDIDLNDKPKMPKKTNEIPNIIKIKAINIEDLRHPFHLWRETWDSADDYSKEVNLDYGEYSDGPGMSSLKYLYEQGEGDGNNLYKDIKADQLWRFFGGISNGGFFLGFPGGSIAAHANLKVDIKNGEDKQLKIFTEIDTTQYDIRRTSQNWGHSNFYCELQEQEPNLKLIRNNKNLHLIIDELTGSINVEKIVTVVNNPYPYSRYWGSHAARPGQAIGWTYFTYTEEQMLSVANAYGYFQFTIKFSSGKELKYAYGVEISSGIPIFPGELDLDLVSDYIDAYGYVSSSLKIKSIDIRTSLYAYAYRLKASEYWGGHPINPVQVRTYFVGWSKVTLDMELNDIKFKYTESD